MHYLQWLINNTIFENNSWSNQISEMHQFDFDETSWIRSVLLIKLKTKIIKISQDNIVRETTIQYDFVIFI